MRCLSRNKQRFQYRNYIGKNEAMIGNLHTGVDTASYGYPSCRMASISPAKGYSETEMFGTLTDYDKVIITNEDLDITENSVVNIETWAQYSGDPYDYIVKRVAKSLNYTAIAIKKVDVS